MWCIKTMLNKHPKYLIKDIIKEWKKPMNQNKNIAAYLNP